MLFSLLAVFPGANFRLMAILTANIIALHSPLFTIRLLPGIIQLKLNSQLLIVHLKLLTAGPLRLYSLFYNGQVKCVYSDGLSVMDDVEGVYGYTKFLVTLHEGTPEERAECKEGASIMGWTERMMKAEKML